MKVCLIARHGNLRTGSETPQALFSPTQRQDLKRPTEASAQAQTDRSGLTDTRVDGTAVRRLGTGSHGGRSGTG